jgi:hypothetical protein
MWITIDYDSIDGVQKYMIKSNHLNKYAFICFRQMFQIVVHSHHLNICVLTISRKCLTIIVRNSKNFWLLFHLWYPPTGPRFTGPRFTSPRFTGPRLVRLARNLQKPDLLGN